MNFWDNKRVFVTGHTGFKGSWLSLWLSQCGAKVFGYSMPPPTNPSLFDLAKVRDVLTGHTIGDIRDLRSLCESLSQSQADVVLHLAAQPLVRASYSEPIETYSTNVMGTVNLLDVCRRQPTVKAVVIVTSDKCYENRATMTAYKEADAMGGHDPYSSSKGCAELVTAAYARSFFDVLGSACSIASVRAGNVIGGGDWARDRLMPDLIHGLLSETPASLRNPRAIRPWQHVLEPLSGYMSVAERIFQRQSDWEGWNFGPDSDGDRTVEEIARLTCQLWGQPDLIRIDTQDIHPHEAGLLKLDSTKAQEKLSWRPRLGFQEAVSWTVDWYKAYGQNADMLAVTLAQIQKYAGLRCPPAPIASLMVDNG